MQLSHTSLDDLEKLKHELLGSLGIIKMLSGSLMQEILDNEKAHNLLHLMHSLAERNIEVVTNFNLK